MKTLLLAILLLSICMNAFAQQAETGDPNIGDWQAKDGKHFAKVYPTKDGAYRTDLVTDLASRDKPSAVLTGQKGSDDLISIAGDGWSGKIEKGKLSISNGSESIEMQRFYRTSPTSNAPPPQGAIVLFDGKNTDSWTKVLEKDWLVGGNPVDNFVILPGDILQATGHEAGKYESLITKQKFGDMKLHLEFRLLGIVTNGGVYLMSRYEINIKDAYGDTGPIAFGNITEANPNALEPSVNVAFPPMQWQTFDIEFRAPRFDATGKTKTENARITLVHNGITVYKDVQLIKVKGATRVLGEAGVGPIYLQEHGTPYQFRNIWVVDKTVQGTENYRTRTQTQEGAADKTGSTEESGNSKKGGRKPVVEDNVTQNKSAEAVTTAEKPVKKGKSITATYDEEMNPAYKETTVNITASKNIGSAKSSGFTHPGVLVNQALLVELKRRVASGVEPQKTAFEAMQKSALAAKDYTPHPVDCVSCGPRSNPDIGCKDEQRDCAAAYTQALLWAITGNRLYAENAIKIMNAWSYTLQKGHTYANGPIQAAWCGSVWPRAAEIIRYTYTGWSEADILKFQNMLRTQYLPSVIHGNCENGNKELAMCEALINIGVFCDDRAVFDLGVKMWRGRTPAYIYLKSDGPTPIEPPGCGAAIWGNKGLVPEFVDGILQETARDSHHPTMAFASMANAAETSYLQGVDLYKEEGKRMMAAIEFEAQYVEPKNVPPPPNLTFGLNSTWEIAYNHFHNRMGFSLPRMGAALPLARPSEGNHHVLWETLTHAETWAVGTPQAKQK
ncbi:MAG: DUF1080 domain-containing protein [Ignavibacteriales bacterium]|nr:DUF1080 domain-containing protein [Ignavibacteriales bacterium]